MKSNLIRVSMFAIIAAGAALAQQLEPLAMSARRGGGTNGMEGVWDVAVTVVNCQTGALIRNVRSLQMFLSDGSFTETTNTGSRGPSLGVWYHAYGQTYGAAYWFFRYNPDGTFASFAQAANAITLSQDGSQFTVTATIQDFDANGTQISNGCVTQKAKKMAAPASGN